MTDQTTQLATLDAETLARETDWATALNGIHTLRAHGESAAADALWLFLDQHGALSRKAESIQAADAEPVPGTAEHRLTDLIDRWKIDTYPAADLTPSVDAMPAFLADIDTVLRDLRQERNGHIGTMQERDHATEAADRLAYAIAPVEAIGEHSSGNDPWANALDVLQQRTTTEWAVQVTSRLTGRSEIVPKPNESSARRAVWDAHARSDQDARVMTREVTAWSAESEPSALVPGRQDTPAEVPLTVLSMTRQAPREFDPCLIRFERRGQEIWANFFDRDGEPTGTTSHPGDMAVAGLIVYYEHRGWSVAEPADDESGAAR